MHIGDDTLYFFLKIEAKNKYSYCQAKLPQCTSLHYPEHHQCWMHK
jgi:hypothetical protein